MLTAWFEPVWDNLGRLAALEILSKPKFTGSDITISAETVFQYLSEPEQTEIFEWQLSVVKQLTPWCDANGLLLTLNLTKQQATGIMKLPHLQHMIAELHPVLRLEISEHFIEDYSHPANDPLLIKMRSLSRLWLDDFGRGSLGVLAVMSGIFEYVKIDKDLLWKLEQSETSGKNFLKALSLLLSSSKVKVLAEGVSNSKTMKFALSSGVNFCQGFRWQGTGAEGLRYFPMKLPRKISALR